MAVRYRRDSPSFIQNGEPTMNDTRTIKVKVDAALAEAVADKSIKRWSTTCHSNGRKYVNVTFEQVAVIGKID